MNESASLLLTRLGVRKKLLTSLWHDSPGMFVGQDVTSGLYHGRVRNAFALVPLEHAEFIPQGAVSVVAHRGLEEYLRGANLQPLVLMLQQGLDLLDTEAAWIRECG